MVRLLVAVMFKANRILSGALDPATLENVIYGGLLPAATAFGLVA
jgi:hypothetical protein